MAQPNEKNPSRSTIVQRFLEQGPPTVPIDRRRRVAVRIWDWSEWCRQVVRGVQSYAHGKADWRLFVDVGQSQRPQNLSPEMKLDGVITHVLRDARAWKRFLARHPAQIVSFATTMPNALAGLPRVRVDEGKVAEIICRHLVSGGLRRIAFCGSSQIDDGTDVRQHSVVTFAERHGYPCAVFTNRKENRESIHMPTLVRWIAGLEKPVGIVAWNIDVARQVAEACKRLEVAVPAQVCIVAWDDDPMLAETAEPTLSAAVLPAERLGYEAAQLLDQLFAGAAAPTSPVIVQPTGMLRVRQSSDMLSLTDREVYLALQFIREHAANPLKVPKIAEHVGISRKKLELDFVRVLNLTPYEAIIDVRMELVKKYLLETNWNSARVAEKSGIGDVSTLRRWFGQREKMTIKEYRLRNGISL